MILDENWDDKTYTVKTSRGIHFISMQLYTYICCITHYHGKRGGKNGIWEFHLIPLIFGMEWDDTCGTGERLGRCQRCPVAVDAHRSGMSLFVVLYIYVDA